MSFCRRDGRVAVADGFNPWTMADHVREMHMQGMSPGQIAWRLKMKQETIEKWIDLGDKEL